MAYTFIRDPVRAGDLVVVACFQGGVVQSLGELGASGILGPQELSLKKSGALWASQGNAGAEDAGTLGDMWQACEKWMLCKMLGGSVDSPMVG